MNSVGRRFESNVSVGVTVSAFRSQSGVAEFLVAVVVSSGWLWLGSSSTVAGRGKAKFVLMLGFIVVSGADQIFAGPRKTFSC